MTYQVQTNPFKVVCFPYSQHFASDSPGISTSIKNREELVESLNAIEFDKLKVFSANTFKRMIIVGTLISIISSTILFLLLLLK